MTGRARVKAAVYDVAGREIAVLTDEERARDLGPHRRLMCQCRILKGTVKLDLD